MFNLNSEQWRSLQTVINRAGELSDHHATFSIDEIKAVHPMTESYEAAVTVTLNSTINKKLATGYVTIWQCGYVQVGAYRIDNKSKLKELQQWIRTAISEHLPIQEGLS